MPVLREALLKVSRSEAIKSAITRAPVTRRVVDRYVAGETTDDALQVTRAVADAGLTVTIDHLGEDTTELAQAIRDHRRLPGAARPTGGRRLADIAEVSVKLSAVGQLLGGDGEKIAPRTRS